MNNNPGNNNRKDAEKKAKDMRKSPSSKLKTTWDRNAPKSETGSGSHNINPNSDTRNTGQVLSTILETGSGSHNINPSYNRTNLNQIRATRLDFGFINNQPPAASLYSFPASMAEPTSATMLRPISASSVRPIPADENITTWDRNAGANNVAPVCNQLNLQRTHSHFPQVETPANATTLASSNGITWQNCPANLAHRQQDRYGTTIQEPQNMNIYRPFSSGAGASITNFGSFDGSNGGRQFRQPPPQIRPALQPLPPRVPVIQPTVVPANAGGRRQKNPAGNPRKVKGGLYLLL